MAATDTIPTPDTEDTVADGADRNEYISISLIIILTENLHSSLKIENFPKFVNSIEERNSNENIGNLFHRYISPNIVTIPHRVELY